MHRKAKNYSLFCILVDIYYNNYLFYMKMTSCVPERLQLSRMLVHMHFRLLLWYCKCHKQQKIIHWTIPQNPRLFAKDVEKNQIILGEMWQAKQKILTHKRYSPQVTQTHQKLAHMKPKLPIQLPPLHDWCKFQSFLVWLLNHYCHCDKGC